MSYIQSTLRCRTCGYEMNVAFGIVGITQLGGYPRECPRCHAACPDRFEHIAYGWQARDVPDTRTAEARDDA